MSNKVILANGQSIVLDVSDKALASTTIAEVFSRFLEDVRRQASSKGLQNVKSVVDLFQSHLDIHGPERLDQKKLRGAGLSFCQVTPVPDMIDHLEKFVLYCMLREQVADEEVRAGVDQVLSHLLNWLAQYGYFTDADKDRIFALKDRLNRIAEKCWRAEQDLHRYLARQSTAQSFVQTVEFGRHDIAVVRGSEIWLEIWSLPLSPMNDQTIGPIKLPRKLAESLQVGWMIVCSLGKTADGKWFILQFGGIHPSLPF